MHSKCSEMCCNWASSLHCAVYSVYSLFFIGSVLMNSHIIMSRPDPNCFSLIILYSLLRPQRPLLGSLNGGLNSWYLLYNMCIRPRSSTKLFKRIISFVAHFISRMKHKCYIVVRQKNDSSLYCIYMSSDNRDEHVHSNNIVRILYQP